MTAVHRAAYAAPWSARALCRCYYVLGSLRRSLARLERLVHRAACRRACVGWVVDNMGDLT